VGQRKTKKKSHFLWLDPYNPKRNTNKASQFQNVVIFPGGNWQLLWRPQTILRVVHYQLRPFNGYHRLTDLVHVPFIPFYVTNAISRLKTNHYGLNLKLENISQGSVFHLLSRENFTKI